MELDEKEKELLKKLREAGRQENKFVLTLTINDELLVKREFSAEHLSKESIVSTRTHFMINDVIRMINKHYSDSENFYQEEKKKKEVEKLWNEKEKEKNGNRE